MTIITFDNRGVGKSSRPNYPYTMDMFVEDIKNLLDYLNVQERIHLCGFSMGGHISQSFVLKYPDKVKTLILCGSGAYIDPTSTEQQLKFFKILKSVDLEQRIQIILPNTFSITFRKKLKEDKKLLELIKNDMGLIAYLKDPPRYQDYINQTAAESGFDTRESLHKIKQPTLIMGGKKDVLAPIMESKFLHEKIPNSRLEVLEGLGHGFMIEEPEKANKIMWDFIQEHLG